MTAVSAGNVFVDSGMSPDAKTPASESTSEMTYQVRFASVASTMGAHRNLMPWTTNAAEITFPKSLTATPSRLVAAHCSATAA